MTCPSRRAAALPCTVSTFFASTRCAASRSAESTKHVTETARAAPSALRWSSNPAARGPGRCGCPARSPAAARRAAPHGPVWLLRRHVRHPHGGAHELGEEQHARRAVADEADARVRAAAAAAADVDGEGGGAEQREHERVERRAAEVVLAELVLHRVAGERADRVARVDVGEERREHAEPHRDDVHRPRDLEVAVRNCAEDEERHRRAIQPYGHRDGPGEDLVAVVVV